MRKRTTKYSKLTVRLTDRQLKIALDRINCGDAFGTIAHDLGVTRDTLQNEIDEFASRQQNTLLVI